MPAFVGITAAPSQIPELLRGRPDVLRGWVAGVSGRHLAACIAMIVLGAGLFGGAVGCWRSPAQALFTAVKLPLILLGTALGNALLNALLAPLLGVQVRFREASMAVLLSFALAAVILGSLAPLLAFLVWNLPPMAAAAEGSRVAFRTLQLTSVAAVAFAGIAANVRLHQLLTALAGRAPATRLLWAWLAANLLLGGQL
ncbi:MAG: hypothetical protein J0L84_12500, partial [Verrucomicrobia bacterium]|nr:hypothetical protein [Verrucomicrobiota bacterium]